MRDWKRRLAVARLVQAEFVQRVDAWIAGKEHEKLSAFVGQNLSMFSQQHSSGVPLILVDLPVVKSGGGSLRYLQEDDGEVTGQDVFQTHSFQESSIWRTLAAGTPLKLRVFCDPNFRDLVRSAIPRATMQEIVVAAARQVKNQ
jgi:hypothetical protein